MVDIVLKIANRFPSLRLAKIIVFFILLSLFFISETREIAIQSVSDAFISVTSFVAATVFVFAYLHKKDFDIQSFIKKHEQFDVFIATFLGAIPGCGGAIMIMTLYVRNAVSFSAVIATLVATMGDAAFLLIAAKPFVAMIVISLTFTIAIVTGYIVKMFENKIAPQFDRKAIYVEEDAPNLAPNIFYKFWIFFLIPGIVLGIINAFGKDINLIFSNINLGLTIGFLGGLLSLGIWLFNPSSDIQIAECRHKNFRSVADLTCFVTAWVIVAFVCYEMIDFATGGKMFDNLIYLGPFLPLAAILVGFIPGCGPQIMITSMYIAGHIPLAAQIGNSISNDGDALFPAIAISPKAAILATLYSAIPAVLVAYVWYYFIEFSF